MSDEKQKNSEEAEEVESGGMVFGVRHHYMDVIKFLRKQIVVKIELAHPMQHGERNISFFSVTAFNEECVRVENGILSIELPPRLFSDETESIPMDNVVKWRKTCYFIPALPKRKGSYRRYEYEPYDFPARMGGYLGSYSDDEGCICFLDDNMEFTIMEERRAEFAADNNEPVLVIEASDGMALGKAAIS